MIRLQRGDFEDAGKLAPLAAAARMAPDEFRRQFGYVVGLGRA
jgi:hypothetical protein